MIIKMLLEEAGQYFYCEARKTSSHEYEGLVHFLHKVGDGNAFVRGKTYHVKSHFDSRNDALTAAEHQGKQIAMKAAASMTKRHVPAYAETGAPTLGRLATSSMEKSAC
ncbi:MAG: hypothetical protein ACKOVA_12465 [Novosphingobium sp.]